jgi:hypothetical protein
MADIAKYVIIFGLGVLGFITFLIAGTMVGLMWLDSWSCGACARNPAGLYILGVLGILLLSSIGGEAGEASKKWEEYAPAFQKRMKALGEWARKNWREFWPIPVAIILSIATVFIVMNWWAIGNWWYCLFA